MTMVYRTRSVRVRPGDPFFAYLDTLTENSGRLHNAVRFRQRQVLTAVQKAEADRTPNEREIMDEIANALPRMSHGFMPTKKKHVLPYVFLEELLKLTDNPDYRREGFPSQTAQQTIKACCREMKSFYGLLRTWKKDKSSLTGKPNLPGYVGKGGRYTATITNQESTLTVKDGRWKLKLPLLPKRLQDRKIDFGIPEDGYKLKETKVIPDNGTYVVSVVLQKEVSIKASLESSRIAAIDFGVDNLMAVSNNCGLPLLLYKGGIVKSVNHNYNKRFAKLMSRQMKKTGAKFCSDDETKRLLVHREDFMSDYMHKTAKHLITWCVENRIDTLVCGVNKGWKQRVNLGKVNNQNFVEIPFAKLRGMLKYLCEGFGITYLEQEESYTSKASFIDRDRIPVYGDNTEDVSFSGKRVQRGLYRTKDGKLINADLNGGANILRKAFPDAFFKGVEPDFSKVVIIRHPDAERIKGNSEVQRLRHAIRKVETLKFM